LIRAHAACARGCPARGTADRKPAFAGLTRRRVARSHAFVKARGVEPGVSLHRLWDEFQRQLVRAPLAVALCARIQNAFSRASHRSRSRLPAAALRCVPAPR
jgi:hypothetical protein